MVTPLISTRRREGGGQKAEGRRQQGDARERSSFLLPPSSFFPLAHSPLLGLALLFVLAVGLRVALVLVLRSDRLPDTTYEHGVIAENLVEGRGFRVWFLGTEGPTSQQAPFYPFLLAGIYWLFGGPGSQALLAMQLLQAVAGGVLVVCLVWLGWQLVPEKWTVGWLAGFGAAVYPTHVYMVSHIQVAVWATLWLVLTLALACWAGRTRRLLAAVLTGIAAGWMLLTDPILAVTLPAVVWCLFRGQGSEVEKKVESSHSPTRPLAHSLARLIAVLLFSAAIVVAPWILRNWLVHGEFVFVKSTFGYAFWQGNNPVSWGTDKVPKASADRFLAERAGGLRGLEQAMWEARHETLYIDDVVLKPGGYAEFQGLSEPQRSRLLMQRAIAFIRENPTAYLSLCAQRLRYFLLFDETNPKTKNLAYRAATLLLLALAVAGLTLGNRWWRPLAPTLLVFVAVAMFHTLTITSARFRIPVEPMQMLWAAVAVVEFVPESRRAYTRRGVP